MQFLDLVNWRLLGFARSPLELLCRPGAVLPLGFDGIVVLVDFFFVFGFSGVVVEFEVLEIKLRFC